MHQSLRPFSLVPSGFVVVSAIHDATNTTITVRGSKESAVCPSCGTVSRRVHSRYHRRVGDLPLSGRSVELLVIARRFRCDAVLCGRQIFVERVISWRHRRDEPGGSTALFIISVSRWADVRRQALPEG